VVDVKDGYYIDINLLINLIKIQCENYNEPIMIDFEDDKVSSNINCQKKMILSISRIII
jgi:hypothetical protein